MALLKIAETDKAFVVWNDTAKAKTQAHMNVEGEKIYFFCLCSSCESPSTLPHKLKVIRSKANENGIKTIFVRDPDWARRFCSEEDGVRLEDIGNEYEEWKRVLLEN